MANKDPKFDGEIRRYDSLGSLEEIRSIVPLDLQSSRNRDLVDRLGRIRERGARSHRQIIYINGIDTTPRKHRNVAEMLATITDHSVIGIYNATGNDGASQLLPPIVADLLQSVGDWTLMAGRARDPIQQTIERHVWDEEQRYNSFREQLRSNLAAVSLFEHLYELCAFDQIETIIVSHSQGNLIAANVVWFLIATLHPFEIRRRMKCIGLASPTPSWPTSGRRNFYLSLVSDLRDPVPLLSVPVIGTPETIVRANTPGDGVPWLTCRIAPLAETIVRANTPGDGLDFSFDVHDALLYLLTDGFLTDLLSEL